MADTDLRERLTAWIVELDEFNDQEGNEGGFDLALTSCFRALRTLPVLLDRIEELERQVAELKA